MRSVEGNKGHSSIKRILIVGGVAGGASCAARARRLSESTEIIMFERGPYVSFANCGLPYYIGDVITEEKDLIIANPNLFRRRFNIDVRVQNEVQSIDREKSEVEVKDLQTGDLDRGVFFSQGQSSKTKYKQSSQQSSHRQFFHAFFPPFYLAFFIYLIP